jgi:YfiH family protein
VNATRAETLLKLRSLESAGLVHAFTTLATGDMSWSALQTPAGQRDLARLGAELGFDPAMLVTAEQVHSSTVAVVHLCDNCGPGNRIPHTDGLITEEPWPLLITVADCFPVILYEPRAPMLALVHCGWRGTVAGILPRAVQRLVREAGTGPSTILAGIGPGICAGCYEVGEDVVHAARDAGLGSHVSADAAGQHSYFDIAGALLEQLLDAGLTPDHVEQLGRCTLESSDLPSYRRDHSAVRAAAVALMPGAAGAGHLGG